jgi:hypothetical protein
MEEAVVLYPITTWMVSNRFSLSFLVIFFYQFMYYHYIFYLYYQNYSNLLNPIKLMSRSRFCPRTLMKR